MVGHSAALHEHWYYCRDIDMFDWRNLACEGSEDETSLLLGVSFTRDREVPQTMLKGSHMLCGRAAKFTSTIHAKMYLKNKFRTMRYLIENHYMPDELKKLAGAGQNSG